jgi:MinD-like ATPase involved in chromosome partitioning or flagellar assembly
VSDDLNLFGGDLQQQPAEPRPPAPAAPGPPRWRNPADAFTEILPVEDLHAELSLAQPIGHLPAVAKSAPAPTRVFDDWQLSPESEGYVPALVALDKLEVRRKTVPAKQGWRGLLHAVTRVNLPPGADELYEIALKDQVQRMVRSTFPIAIVGVKGGVGKTVVTEALGSTFSAVRGDRVIAVDLDPDAGNLISRHGRESAMSIADLVAGGSLSRYLDVRAHTSQNKATRLEVLTGPDFARTPIPLLDSDVDKMMPILNEHYSLVLMDTGTGLKTNLMTAVLRQSRALVMVSSASIDALEETRVSLEWLRCNGFQRLLDTMVLVINNIQRGKPNINVDRAVQQFSHQIDRDRIFSLPFDTHIFEGMQITLELLSPKSRRRYLELAAALAVLFPSSAAD